MTPVPITSLDELKREAARDGGLNGFISLNGGARSSKLFSHNPDNDSWSVLHEISGSESLYETTDAMLAEESTIAKALEVGAVYAHWIDHEAPLHEMHEDGPSPSMGM